MIVKVNVEVRDGDGEFDNPLNVQLTRIVASPSDAKQAEAFASEVIEAATATGERAARAAVATSLVLDLP